MLSTLKDQRDLLYAALAAIDQEKVREKEVLKELRVAQQRIAA